MALTALNIASKGHKILKRERLEMVYRSLEPMSKGGGGSKKKEPASTDSRERYGQICVTMRQQRRRLATLSAL